MEQILDVREAARIHAENLKPKARKCRPLGHAWEEIEAPHHLGDGNQQLHVECGRCHSERIIRIDKRGRRSSRYYYADGYLVQGLGRPSSETNFEFWRAYLTSAAEAKRRSR